MKKIDIELIENQIGYTFHVKDLLIQAFTHKTYAKEHGIESNILLKFFGDDVLNYYVSKYIREHYGTVAHEKSGFKNSEQITHNFIDAYGAINPYIKWTYLKRDYVSSKNLAKRITYMKLNEYIMLNDFGINQKFYNQIKVQAELFKAILGAVAIDSDYNELALMNTIDFMLNTKFDELYWDYIYDIDYPKEIQEWYFNKYGELPIYDYSKLDGLYYAKLKVVLDVEYNFTGYDIYKYGSKFNCAMNLYEFLEEREEIKKE